MTHRKALKPSVKNRDNKASDKTDETNASLEGRSGDDDMELSSGDKIKLLEEARSKVEDKWMLWIM